MKRTIGLAMLAASLTASAAGAADAPELKSDLRCLVVMVNLSAAPENAKKMEALIGGFYFMGKLDARDPKLDIEKRVIAEVQGIDAVVATPSAVYRRGALLAWMSDDDVRALARRPTVRGVRRVVLADEPDHVALMRVG